MSERMAGPEPAGSPTLDHMRIGVYTQDPGSIPAAAARPVMGSRTTHPTLSELNERLCRTYTGNNRAGFAHGLQLLKPALSLYKTVSGWALAS